MEFKSTPLDKAKFIEFHTPQYTRTQLRVKNMVQTDLIKAIDELTEVVDSNTKRIKQLQERLENNMSEENKQLYETGIEKYTDLSILANKVSEIYLMQLDIYTYGTYFILAKDEWDWRAFARHFYTILKEHPNTVNKQLNFIIKILQKGIDVDYDLSSLIRAKRDFSSFIDGNVKFANQIRVNVDAHFDGNFDERIKLITNLSYYSVIELYCAYNSKMHEFLKELKPALVRFRYSADSTYHSLV